MCLRAPPTLSRAHTHSLNHALTYSACTRTYTTHTRLRARAHTNTHTRARARTHTHTFAQTILPSRCPSLAERPCPTHACTHACPHGRTHAHLHARTPNARTLACTHAHVGARTQTYGLNSLGTARHFAANRSCALWRRRSTRLPGSSVTAFMLLGTPVVFQRQCACPPVCLSVCV